MCAVEAVAVIELVPGVLECPRAGFPVFLETVFGSCSPQKRHRYVENLFENTLGSFKYKLSEGKRSTGAGKGAIR